MKKDIKSKIDQIIEKIVSENIDSVMEDRFSRYSKYIIQQSATWYSYWSKTSSKRILYSMSDLGLLSSKPFKKSS